MSNNASLRIPVVDGLLGRDCRPFQCNVFGFEVEAFQIQFFYHSLERDWGDAPDRTDWIHA